VITCTLPSPMYRLRTPSDQSGQKGANIFVLFSTYSYWNLNASFIVKIFDVKALIFQLNLFIFVCPKKTKHYMVGAPSICFFSIFTSRACALYCTCSLSQIKFHHNSNVRFMCYNGEINIGVNSTFNFEVN
jgi:hypothetical protein